MTESTNMVVRNALKAKACNGYHIAQYTKGGWFVVGFSGDKNKPLIDEYAGRGESYVFPSESSARRFVDTVLKKIKPRGTFSVDEDRGVAFGPGPGKPNMNSTAANAEVAKNATAQEVERRLKAILSTEMPKVKKLYNDARAIDKSIKSELNQIYHESDQISDEDAKRLGKIIYDIRTMSPFGSL